MRFVAKGFPALVVDENGFRCSEDSREVVSWKARSVCDFYRVEERPTIVRASKPGTHQEY
jgi:hypothetical protein